MRIFVIHFFVFLMMCFSAVVEQQNKARIEKIKEEFKIINNESGLKTIVLNNEEFLDHMPDGGGQLTGLYKKGALKKLVCRVGLSSGNEIKEYYFKDDQLIFIYEQFNSFLYDKMKQHLLFDRTERTFEGRYYFYGGKLIDLITKGHSKFRYDQDNREQTLLKEANDYGKIISKRKNN